MENLAAEAGYRPPRPEGFGYELRERMRGPREKYEERRREAERLKPRRDELLRVVAEAGAALESATAFTPLEEVERAQSRLSAGYFLLSLIPEAAEDDKASDAIRAGEEIRSAASSRLEGWRAVLSRELERLRGEVEELERGGAPLDLEAMSGPHVRILEDLDAVSQAISDADRCIGVARALQVGWARQQPEGDDR